MALTRCLPATLLVALGACGGARDDAPPSLPASAYESTTQDPQAIGAPGTAGGRPPAPAPAPTPAPALDPSAAVDRWSGEAEAFRGDLGDVRAFDGVGASVAGVDDGAGASHVRLDAVDPGAGWWAMTQLHIEGTLGHAALQPGARRVFRRPEGRATPGGGALFVTAIGCSGPRRDRARYDSPAQEVVVAVTDGPAAGTRRLEFTATFSSPAGAQEVTGSFVYDAP